MVRDAGVRSDGDDGEIRALGGHGGGSDAGSGLADDGVGVNGLGEAGGGGRNGVVDTGFLTDGVVGDGGDAFSIAQTDLMGANKLRKVMDTDYPILTPPTVTFRSTFRTNEANFDWKEWGVFNAASGGVMLNRVVESNVTKQDNQTWILEVAITFAIGT